MDKYITIKIGCIFLFNTFSYEFDVVHHEDEMIYAFRCINDLGN